MNKLSEKVRKCTKDVHAYHHQERKMFAAWADRIEQLEQQLFACRDELFTIGQENQRLQDALTEAENWIKRYENKSQG